MTPAPKINAVGCSSLAFRTCLGRGVWIAVAIAVVLVALAPAASLAQPCTVPDNGSGTITLPPEGCDYLSPAEVHMIIDGLPPGTTIELDPIHMQFMCIDSAMCSVPLPPGECETPGGIFGGDADCFESALRLDVSGTGMLAGFNRTLFVPVFTEVHTGPRNPGDPVQTFPNEMYRVMGELFGDPDFCTFRVTGGTDFGLPGPGQTTLTDLGGGIYNVDSFFDVMYQIEFEGCPGSMLEGFVGITTAVIRMQTGQAAELPQACCSAAGPCQDVVPSACGGTPMGDGTTCLGDYNGDGIDDACDPDLCSVPDNGTGTVTLPPQGCEYLSPDEVHEIIDGLPPGTTIELDPIHMDFICGQDAARCSMPLPVGDCETAGGSLGGHGDCFDSTLALDVSGTGGLAGFNRTLWVPVFTEVHTGPRNPGDPVQNFPSDMYRLQGELFGDPDFCTFRVTGGTDFGLPSPGETTATQLPSGDFAIDSFFDVMYQIEFQGCPGSVLDGYAGITTATIHMETGHPQVAAPEPCCLGDGTCSVMPPQDCLAQGGTPTSACWGDYNGDGIDDACDPDLCAVPDNGTGTITLPPQGCDYLSPDEVHAIIAGLPAGTTIELDPIHMDFICRSGAMCSMPLGSDECETAGGSLGGHGDCFDSTLDLTVSGTGSLAGFNRHLAVPVFTEIHTGPRNPGDPVQNFPSDMYRLQGELFGDPDFCTFRVIGGTDFGLPSPGETTATQLPSGDFAVDSFFDVTYQIEFEGCPGSQLDGYAGTTTATIRMETGHPPPAPEACCRADGTCLMAQAEECIALGGIPQGPGSACTAPAGCCLQDGSCAMVDPLCCDELGGTPAATCKGDYNGDGIDDACDPDLCRVPDNGTGTVNLPPQGCDYLGPNEVHQIIAGLPPGTTIELDPIHMDFINVVPTPGGTLGGEIERFDSTLDLTVSGTGDLAGFNRHLAVPVASEVHTGPRNPGDPVQAFPADMFRLQGELFGDPDFCEFIVIGGTDFGLPSPGQTTLTQLPDGDFAVDSFFDVSYQIQFQGCPGSVLDGYMGATTATIRMETGHPVPTPEPCCLPDGTCVEIDPGVCIAQGGTRVDACWGDYNGDGIDDACDPDLCLVPDNGTGTVTLPPQGCDYLSPEEVHLIIDGLPPGTTIELDPIHMDFICRDQMFACSLPLPAGSCEMPGGSLGGDGDCFESTLDLTVSGTGGLNGFNRHLAVPVFTEIHTGPRNPGDPVQTFPNDMYRLQGELFGDPDFCTFRVTGGTDFGLPGPGETTLTQLPTGDFAVDSFFDVTYQIEFEGCPGSQLDGYQGTTTATVRMQTGHVPNRPQACCQSDGTCQMVDPADCTGTAMGFGSVCKGDYNGDGIDDLCDPDLCRVPDNGSGTVNLPPEGCDYLGPNEVHEIINGLPPGTTIELDPIHMDFINVQANPGGTLGGERETFDSTLDLTVTGTGDLAGFNRHLAAPVSCEVHTGPRNPGDPVQAFPADMYRLQGELFGDPDFCTFRVTGGTDFGLPSPGQTTATQLPDGDFAVDSFFDVTYQIEFEGCPGSQLDGYTGTTAATIRMETGHPVPIPEPCCLPGGTCVEIDPGQCVAQGGTRVDACWGDYNGDGIDDACDPDLCLVPDNGTGTVTLPPQGCDYLSPEEVHLIIDGLPPGTTIELDPIHMDFICGDLAPIGCSLPLPPGTCEMPGGSMGGHGDCFESTLDLDVSGTGSLAGFNRHLAVPVFTEVHTGPRNPGDPVQDFPSDMYRLQGELFGDPDFCTFRVTGGTDFGLPGPGHTTLTQLPSGDFAVDSFFDVTYQIEFEGCPGSQLDGFVGTTTATIRMQTGHPMPDPEACCLQDGTCIMEQTNVCLAMGGTPQGPGSMCTAPEACCSPGAGTCLMVDPLCCADMGGSPQGLGTACTAIEACCIDAGVCLDLDPLCCVDMGGSPQGPGTACVDMTIACCLPDGTCFETDPLCCDDLGGTPGYEPHCLGDNNGNTIDDACEPPSVAPARPDPDDAYDISGLVVPCASDEDCREGVNLNSRVYCVPPEMGDPLPGDCYVARNRYISIDPNPDNDGIATARRVSLDTGGAGVVLGWVGAPIPTPVSGPEITPQLIARLVDANARHYRDWSLDEAGGPWLDATLHVGDCEVSPGYRYLIQAIELGEDITDETAYSEALALRTVTDFGDVTGSSAGLPPDSVRNFKDISAVVRGFQGAQLEPKTWLDLQGANATPELPDFSDINFKDIDWAVKGFQGTLYPFADPCDCPGQSCR